MCLEDLRDFILVFLCIGFIIYMIFIGCIKTELYLTREKIEIYQEMNIIDEDTKKILIEKLDI